LIRTFFRRGSQGPPLDGRIKPDISAPANLIASAENSFFAVFDPLLEVDNIAKGGSKQWSFGIRTGASAAAPLVAGIVALMLEADDDLPLERVKELLLAHAGQDGFTGALPNQVWGYGKVNAYQAIAGMEQTTSTRSDAGAEPLTVFPNPSRGDV